MKRVVKGLMESERKLNNQYNIINIRLNDKIVNKLEYEKRTIYY